MLDKADIAWPRIVFYNDNVGTRVLIFDRTEQQSSLENHLCLNDNRSWSLKSLL